MIPKRVCKSNSINDTVSYEEIATILDEKDIDQTISYLMANIYRCKIDERLFCFIFRKFRPFLHQIINATIKQKANCDLRIFKSFTKILQFSEIKYERFIEYFTEQDITQIFENISECPEKLKESLILLIECISIKFKQSCQLFKDIISNQLILFNITQVTSNDLIFIFKILAHFININCFEPDLHEYYSQYILPCVLYIPVANVDIVSKLIDSVCSMIPDCQKLTLKFFIKMFNEVTSQQQSMIIELTAKIVHINFFFRSIRSIEGEFCEILNLALKSENFLVIDSIIDFFCDTAVKKFITDSFKTILPQIFGNLYKLSKNFWRNEQRYKTIQTIGDILKIDIDVFEACLIRYNSKRMYKGSKDLTLDNEYYCLNQVRKNDNNFN